MLHSQLPHFHFNQLSSTQDEVFRLFEQKQAAPFLVSADEQSSGRGRLGRTWSSEPGRSLLFSLGLKLPVTKLIGLSLVAGLGAHDAIQINELQLKWPNDLMLGENKIGGILIESKSQGDFAEISIGVGVNLLDQLSSSYRGVRKQLDALAVAEKILGRVEKFAEKGFQIYKSDYEKVMWHLGQTIALKIQDEEKKVKAIGVSETGYLITEETGQIKMTDQGEILIA
jgi:biotin-[acetyl-CoA-carboxylase] ligase BirA-like protein